jgi:hypothetical protein
MVVDMFGNGGVQEWSKTACGNNCVGLTVFVSFELFCLDGPFQERKES